LQSLVDKLCDLVAVKPSKAIKQSLVLICFKIKCSKNIHVEFYTKKTPKNPKIKIIKFNGSNK